MCVARFNKPQTVVDNLSQSLLYFCEWFIDTCFFFYERLACDGGQYPAPAIDEIPLHSRTREVLMLFNKLKRKL